MIVIPARCAVTIVVGFVLNKGPEPGMFAIKIGTFPVQKTTRVNLLFRLPRISSGPFQAFTDGNRERFVCGINLAALNLFMKS